MSTKESTSTSSKNHNRSGLLEQVNETWGVFQRFHNASKDGAVFPDVVDALIASRGKDMFSDELEVLKKIAKDSRTLEPMKPLVDSNETPTGKAFQNLCDLIKKNSKTPPPQAVYVSKAPSRKSDLDQFAKDLRKGL